MEAMINRYQPALAPIAPVFRPWVLAMVQGLLPLLLRLRIVPWLPAAITRIEVVGDDTLAHCWQRFASGQARLILAFRHVEVDDPLLGLHLLSRVLPRRAARLGLKLPAPLHAQFLFDRGMPLWGGRPLGWLLASLGGVSLRRGREPDWAALRQARQLVLAGRFPFALAPEGATNGHSERIGSLQQGVAQLALWCVDDLRQAGRIETVLLVPIAIQYTYLREDWPRLAALMATLETRIGILAPGSPIPPRHAPGQGAVDTSNPAACPYGRLVRLAEAFLDRLEHYYGGPRELLPKGKDADRDGSRPLAPGARRSESFTAEAFTSDSASASAGLGEPMPAMARLQNRRLRDGEPSQHAARAGRCPPQPLEPGQAPALGSRIERLVERCLVLAESFFGSSSSGTAEQRCRRLEEQSWRWIYREDLPPRHQLSPLDRALADRAAHGASLAVLPMRLAETFVAVSGSYVAERPSFERFMETSLLIHDALARICGEGLPARPRLGARRARISIGAAIDVSARCHGRTKGERRQLLSSLSEDLRQAFEQALI